MGFIWTLIVGAIIGAIAGAVVGKGDKMGCFFNIGAGLLGSFVGSRLFGNWGPSLAGMPVLPSVIGAIIVVIVVSFIFGRKK
ncbi:MAG: GlsB/YeaQ/YmgE family stress response membrane protein [Lachnospiraceae bacterium]|nr:GlsB/YeaQ/YmgE family stress response membrane protein [Lachnospiraceae bacterium]